MPTDYHTGRYTTVVDRVSVIGVPATDAFLSPATFFGDRLSEIEKNRCDGVVVDLQGLTTVDSSIVEAAADFTGTLRMLGYEVAICGLSPRCAIIMVEMGLSFGEVKTLCDAEQAIEWIRARLGAVA